MTSSEWMIVLPISVEFHVRVSRAEWMSWISKPGRLLIRVNRVGEDLQSASTSVVAQVFMIVSISKFPLLPDTRACGERI